MSETLWYVAVVGATAFGLVFGLTPLVRTLALARGWVSRPARDRWGRRVIARAGGLALYVGFLATSLLWLPHDRQVIVLLVGATLVFLVGLLDDLQRMRPYTKLLFQLIVGCLMVIGGIRIELLAWPWLAIPLSVFWFVFVMNAFNLLDNMDGLAAGIGAIAAGFCLVHAILAHQWGVALTAAVVSGTTLGFLRYNFPPARIFMGDSGSHLLGLSLASLALMGSWRQSTHLVSVLLVPTFVLAVPIFDTCFVTIQRLTHRQHPFLGGTDHVSHRLAILGLSERQTVLALYGLSAIFGTLSLLTVRLSLMASMAVWLLTLSGLLLVGAYLAKVSVYELQRQPLRRSGSVPRAPVTLIETMLMHKRRLLEVLTDFTLIYACYVGAYLLRFEGALVDSVRRLLLQSLPVVLVMQLACFTLFGLYRRVWRYMGLPDLVTVWKAVTVGTSCSALAVLYFWRFEGYPRAVFIIDWLLLFVAVSGSRMVERFLNEWITSVSEHAVPVVIIGAGDTGALALRVLKQNGAPQRRVIGFLDDDLRKQGSRIHGLPVLGTREALPALIARRGICEVLIAVREPPQALIEFVRRACDQAGVKWQLVQTPVSIST